MRPEMLLIAAGVLAVVFVIAKFLYKTDTKIENRRRAASRIASILRSNGMVYIPELLEDYTVGDYSGMAIKIEKLGVVLTHNPDAIQGEFDKVFDRILTAQLADPVKKAALLAKIAAATAPAPKAPPVT